MLCRQNAEFFDVKHLVVHEVVHKATTRHSRVVNDYQCYLSCLLMTTPNIESLRYDIYT